MSLVDSSAAFERKCRDFKGGDTLFEGLAALGISDFSTLAFTLGTPQKPPTDEQFDALGARVFTSATLGQLALLRKLHFEATTSMVASINEQVKSDSSDPTSLIKRLPTAEKQARFDLQKKRLAGLKIMGELSPSHHLLDQVNAMVETGVISWISPSKCSKRDDEVQANIKPATSTLQVEQSTLKLAQVPIIANADVGTELKLQWAMQRRGVAMDQCRLLDWSLHEDWVQWLLQSLTKDVPSGFTSVKLDQVIRADKELWTILAQQQSKSLKPVGTDDHNRRFTSAASRTKSLTVRTFTQQDIATQACFVLVWFALLAGVFWKFRAVRTIEVITVSPGTISYSFCVCSCEMESAADGSPQARASPQSPQ